MVGCYRIRWKFWRRFFGRDDYWYSVVRRSLIHMNESVTINAVEAADSFQNDCCEAKTNFDPHSEQRFCAISLHVEHDNGDHSCSCGESNTERCSLILCAKVEVREAFSTWKITLLFSVAPFWSLSLFQRAFSVSKNHLFSRADFLQAEEPEENNGLRITLPVHPLSASRIECSSSGKTLSLQSRPPFHTTIRSPYQSESPVSCVSRRQLNQEHGAHLNQLAFQKAHFNVALFVPSPQTFHTHGLIRGVAIGGEGGSFFFLL